MARTLTQPGDRTTQRASQQAERLAGQKKMRTGQLTGLQTRSTRGRGTLQTGQQMGLGGLEQTPETLGMPSVGSQLRLRAT